MLWGASDTTLSMSTLQQDAEEGWLARLYTRSASGVISCMHIQLEVTYPNVLGPRGVQITEMFG